MGLDDVISTHHQTKQTIHQIGQDFLLKDQRTILHNGQTRQLKQLYHGWKGSWESGRECLSNLFTKGAWKNEQVLEIGVLEKPGSPIEGWRVGSGRVVVEATLQRCHNIIRTVLK